MANQQGTFAGAGENDQERLLDQASAEVKQQAFYMKRAIESDNLREALKYSSNVLCELRTSLLSPKNYYELYMRVFNEMQNLSGFFDDKSRGGRKMLELYESVQHAGNIVPRLYLLATVTPSYIKSKEAPAKEILKDVNELCKGVQHPIRGLFLRYYLSQMVRDKLPDTGSEYEGEGGCIDDAFEFVFNNFCESNKLWVRMQHQGSVKDKQKREKERYDLRVLVGSNLVRLSQLEGMNIDYYEKSALPKLLDHVVSVKDKMSQEYLFESIIQVFPDDFHIRTLEQVLAAYTKALPAVDMKPIMVTLMNRLASFISNAEEGTDALSGVDVFSLFRAHLQQILERALEPAGAAGGGAAGAPDVAAPLEVQSAFLQFTVSMYPDKVHYVDIILGSTVELLQKYFARSESGRGRRTLEGNGADRVVDLLSSPLKSLSVSVLDMEHYPKLMSFLNFETRKQVAVAMINVVVEDDRPLTNVDTVSNLFTFITPLIKDEDDTMPFESYDKDTFILEQQLVCKLVHQVKCDDTDVAFHILSAMRGFFGQGGPHRMAHTLIPVYYAAMSLIPQIRAREQKRQELEEDIPAPAVSVKKVFQFMHKTNTALKDANAEASLSLWLSGATIADQADRWEESRGLFEPMCYEFMTQALICFEEEISESMKQYQGIYSLVGAVSNMTCLETENYDTISQKITQHGARLLKKPLQCRAVATCSHLFWCNARRDGKRVLECLQKCLKITDGVVQSDSKQVVLWVEMLDKYIYYFEDLVEEVTVKNIEALYNMCLEHINFAKSDTSSADQAGIAIAHLKSAHGYLRRQKASKIPEVATRFADLQLDDSHL
eukprot:CAMPEP_0179372190 /NCGR_PEP_ID=MMETSP0797-20121207/86131_1 /TAXON_ID=47934 /ORGANISM="Dinophysis acuminata, Strain DAEP01" /LENGTH=831 /DNA_ID=CAMNT_0021088101 /DNA_START=70 /DNA_END=2565 /DNA_ORIENTATION=+